jgi:hypothetical protein
LDLEGPKKWDTERWRREKQRSLCANRKFRLTASGLRFGDIAVSQRHKEQRGDAPTYPDA